MIIFDTEEFSGYFNQKIHSFLVTEYIDMRDPDDPYDSLDLFFPDYLLREQKDKCLSTALDLTYWSGDDFRHKLTPFHQYGLYNFLRYVEDYRNEDRLQFDNIYYNNVEDIKAIEREWALVSKGQYEEELFTTIKGFRRLLHDIGTMIDSCFEDTDFITVPYLLGNAPMAEMNSILPWVEDYGDLLPRDIAQQYEQLHDDKGDMDLFDDLGYILEELSHNVKYRNQYKLFWNDKIPLSEVDVHACLEAILMAYFQKSKVIIDREVDTGTGKIDFRFTKHPSEKVLIEVKLASSQNLLRGFMKQLTHYMDAERCLEAYYLIICYTEDEVQKGEKFISQLPAVSTKKVDVKILDVSRKISASKLH